LLSIFKRKTMKKLVLILFLISISVTSFAQELPFKKVKLSDSVALENQMQQLAIQCDIQSLSAIDQFKFQLIRGEYKDALTSIKKRIAETPRDQSQYLDVYKYYVEAKLSTNFKDAFKNSYSKYIKNSDDIQVINLDKALIVRDPTDYYVSKFNNTYTSIKSEKITQATATDLVKKYFLSTVFSSTRVIYFDEIKQDHKRRYVINDSIVIPMKDGAEVSMVVVNAREIQQLKNLPY
jgi:hypothetical protein